ncbi:MAG: Crp/Fnr family transcriptional regulator [Bacteroidota bacterium]
MEKITIKKGQFLQRKGERSTRVYIVLSGLLRSYSIDNKGKEHIFMFAPEHWTIADSNPPDMPSELYIDAIENSTLIAVEKNEESPNIEKILRRINVLQKRIILLMSASAIERYEHFIETYPDIVQRVPQRMIASYLGITPEALSKVKGQRRKKT